MFRLSFGKHILLILVLLTSTFPLSVFGQTDSLLVRSADSTNVFTEITRPFEPIDNLPGVNYGRLAIVSGTLLTGMTAIHLYQEAGWWKDNRRSFHFQEDLKYGLSIDKIGHFFASSLLTIFMSKSFEWTNMSETSALFWGAGAAAAFQTFIEVEDGFSTWGFDRVDFAANMAGAAWPVARHYSPFLRNFDFKFGYHPSPLLDNPGGVGFQGQKHIMFDDYEGQTIWLGLKVKNLLPKSIDSYWPAFLGIAVGYGVRDIASNNPYRVFLIGLDLDMTNVIPQTTPFLKTLGEILNFGKMPLPAVQISPSAVWYGIYF